MFRKYKTLFQGVTHLHKSSISTLKPKADFTKNQYKVEKGLYNPLTDRHIDYFRNLLGENGLVMDLSNLERYNVDWMSQLRGSSSLVLRPKATEQVSTILKYCNENLLAVCTQGGNTCMTGGATPIFDEIILSTELMNKIIDLDEMSGVLTCQAGCILEDLQNYLKEKDLLLPLDLGAKGSCHIGGNVSTNAGGIRLIRYGNLHSNVLGLEVVQANGEVLDCLSTLKKDNTGFHLKNLFIGSEGSLGFVTKVAIQCPPQPNSSYLAFLGLQDYQNVLKTFQKAKHDIGEILSAVEVMDFESMNVMKQHMNMPSPIGEYPYYLLIEISGNNEKFQQEQMEHFLETAMDSHLILNGIVSTDIGKFNELWALRKLIPETFKKDGHVFIYDLSLPLKHYYNLVDEMRTYMGNRAHRVYGFGHLGDSNIHLQIVTKEYNADIVDYMEPYLYKRVNEMKGSISAEHGIGFLKKKYLPMVKSGPTLNLMKNLKQQMDPNRILNPYKIL